MDVLDDLPAASRSEVVAAVRAAWPRDLSVAEAESVLRASEVFWNELEDRGGVDSWGGWEFCRVFPLVLALIYGECNP